jgi:hypothetical protein
VDTTFSISPLEHWMFEAEKIIHVCALVYGRVMGSLNKLNITSKVIVPAQKARMDQTYIKFPEGAPNQLVFGKCGVTALRRRQ